MSEHPDIPEQTRELLRLFLIPGIGPQLSRVLLKRFGSVERIFAAPSSELAKTPHIGTTTADQIKQAMSDIDVDAECKVIAEHGVAVMCRPDAEYPKPLQSLAVPPLLLFRRGTYVAEDEKAVAIVGSRTCTSYGKRIAERLAADLASRGYTIVSGLARGIDGFAHRGALAAKGRTIAVLAGGLASIYPPEHKQLAEQVQQSGCLFSESPMLREPLAAMFPARNRIISGLSQGVIIVEANEKSGALITARHAAEQGREVFAVPGPVDSAASAGPLNLIRQGAKLVRNVDDVVEELEGGMRKAPSPRPVEPKLEKAAPPSLNDNQRKIWDLLGDEPTQLDTIAQKLNIAVQQLVQELMMMEMKRLVRRLPGNQYERR